MEAFKNKNGWGEFFYNLNAFGEIFENTKCQKKKKSYNLTTSDGLRISVNNFEENKLVKETM